MLANVWFKDPVYGINSVLDLQNVWVETPCLTSACSRVLEQAVNTHPVEQKAALGGPLWQGAF